MLHHQLELSPPLYISTQIVGLVFLKFKTPNLVLEMKNIPIHKGIPPCHIPNFNNHCNTSFIVGMVYNLGILIVWTNFQIITDDLVSKDLNWGPVKVKGKLIWKKEHEVTAVNDDYDDEK